MQSQLFLLGEWDNYDRDRGTLKELDRVCKVIENGTCAEIRLRGEDKTYECLTDILDNSGIAPEEWARQRGLTPELRADILMNGTIRIE